MYLFRKFGVWITVFNYHNSNTLASKTQGDLDLSKINESSAGEEQLYAEIEDAEQAQNVGTAANAPTITTTPSPHYDDVVLEVPKPAGGDYQLTLCAAYGVH